MVTPGSHEEGRRRVWSYAEAIHQGWGCRPCESLDLGRQVLYLITELTVATGKGAKSILGRRGGTLHTTRPEALGPGDKGSSGEASEVLTKPGRGRDNQGQKWLRKSEQGDKWNRCLIEGMIVLSETGARDEQTTPP